MSMRKWERNVAKHRMELMGYDCINKKQYKASKINKKGEERTYLKSAFALNWRNLVNAGNKLHDRYLKVRRLKGTA